MTRGRIVKRCCRIAGLTVHPDTAARLGVHLKRMGAVGVVLWAVYGALAALPAPVARRVANTSTLRPAIGVLAAASWAGGVAP